MSEIYTQRREPRNMRSWLNGCLRGDQTRILERAEAGDMDAVAMIKMLRRIGHPPRKSAHE